MARAPTYTPQRDRVDPSGERFRAANDGGGVAGGIARGLQIAGQAGSDWAATQDAINAQYDRTMARSLGLEFRKRAGEIEMQFKTLKGENAMLQGPAMQKALEDLRSEYLGKAGNERMGRFLGEIVDERAAATAQSMSGHTIEQGFVFQNETISSELTENAENAANSLERPEEHSRFISAARDNLKELGELNGWDEATLKSKTRMTLSTVHDAAITQMLNQPDADLDTAWAYFRANEDEMTASARNEAMAKFKGPMDTRIAQADFYSLLGGNSSPPAETGGGADGSAPGITPRQRPVAGATGDGFAQHRARGSAGIDIPAAAGTAIKPAAEGVVVEAGTGKTGGNFVRIRHPDGTMTSYMHMQHPPKLAEGDRVTPSTVIGTVGMTGRASGNHLHLEVKDAQGRQIDPEEYLKGASVLGTADEPREWDIGALHAEIDKKVASKEWTFERGERARNYALNRVERDTAIMAQRESQAYEDALDWVLTNRDNFTDLTKLPKAIRDRLPSDRLLQLGNMADSIKTEKEGGGIKANGDVATALDMERFYEPEKFISRNLGEVAGSVTAAELNTFAKEQAKMRMDEGKWSPRTGITTSLSYHSKLDGKDYSPAQEAAILKLMEKYVLSNKTAGKEPGEDVYRDAYRYATGNVRTQTSFLGFSTGAGEEQRFRLTDEVEKAQTENDYRRAFYRRTGRWPTPAEVKDGVKRMAQ